MAGCSPSSSTTAAVDADFVMEEGEGPGQHADDIASQVMLPNENGVVPTLVSAEHMAIIELPTRTIEFVFYQVADLGPWG